MKLAIIEFWDCHYELFDSYITSLIEANTFIDIHFYCLHPKKAEEQCLLIRKNKLMSISFRSLSELYIESDFFDLIIVNTSHIHQNQNSFDTSMAILRQLNAKKIYIVCHNQYDYSFYDQFMSENVYAVFLGYDALDSYTNIDKSMHIIYEPVSDYDDFITVSSSAKIRVAIAGILRQGKAIGDIRSILEKKISSIEYVLIGSYNGRIDPECKEMISDGLFDELIIENQRMTQKRFIESVASCDLLLDLGIRDNNAQKKSVTGSLQLSRSLNLPLLMHTNRCSSFISLRYMNYSHLETILSSSKLRERVNSHKDILKLMKMTNKWKNTLSII